MYDLDPIVEEKIVSSRDRARLTEKLRTFPEKEQKQWIANPAVSFLLQWFLSQLTSGVSSVPVSATTKSETKKDEKKKEEPDEEPEDEPSVFDLFD